MGRANRERRRTKEKARRQARPTPGSTAGSTAGSGGEAFFAVPPMTPGWASRPPTSRQQVEHLVDEAVHALDHDDRAAVSACTRRLTAPDAGWRGTVERVLDDALRQLVTQLWGGGWQPADLMRITTRQLKAPHQQLARAVIAQEMSGYAAATVDPRWSAQLAEAGAAQSWWPRDTLALPAWARAHPGGWPDAVEQAVELLYALSVLPAAEVLMPVPGTAVPARTGPDPAVDERILTRVRALLAKAESTPYPAEAETFTAGAQSLMARHSIDHAMLAAAGRAPADVPEGRRLGIDNPYELPKATLLDAVASANRCRSVWTKNFGYATVIGHRADLDTVELLFTSLLVQATSTLTQQGTRTARDGASRTRSFRQSFLLSFAQRIRERLSETTRHETDAAVARPGHDGLLPVLRSRDEAVQRATTAMFPRLTDRPVAQAWDHEGWASGRAAADRAALSRGAAGIE